MEKEKRITLINGKKVDYYIIKKKIKNMNMRLSDSGEILISIPKYIPLQKAEDFLKSKYSWIEKQQTKYEKFSKIKETDNFIEGDYLYFLGKQYYLKIIPSKTNFMCFNGDYIELHIKEKYCDNKDYLVQA